MNHVYNSNDRNLLIDLIDQLPKGNITHKTIKGKDYYYHRYSENGKRFEKYIPFDQLPVFRSQIELRKTYETQLKELTSYKGNIETFKDPFDMHVLVGNRLIQWCASVSLYRHRKLYYALKDYLYGLTNDKVFILYGLRRTGKTTMIRQIIANMDSETLSKTALIQCTGKDSLAILNHDLDYLKDHGYINVFIDEITQLNDFIEGAALLSDIYAAGGMHIVLSGTDSLGFLLAEDRQLYDRCIMVHTTFIPYHEFESVLNIKGIDNYIIYGGTMSYSGIKYHDQSPFSTVLSTEKYVDSAIAENLQHSLAFYQYGNHFRGLSELYQNHELTNVINRVVEDMNHRFTFEVLTKLFKSNDLGISAANLRSDRFEPSTILDRIDKPLLTRRLKQKLKILDNDEVNIKIEQYHVDQIKQYLLLMDVITLIDVHYLPDIGKHEMKTVISQPGLRYAQAKALIECLLLDPLFSALDFSMRQRFEKRILNEIRGRMMEEIVLLETTKALKHKQVFTLQFDIGEYDMVVVDKDREYCDLYEIKHSDKIEPNQYRYLHDRFKLDMTEHRYGSIHGKHVIYRGKSQEVDGIHYINVEEYLNDLWK